MELSPEQGNMSPSSCHIHTCKMTGPTKTHFPHDQLHVPLAVELLSQEQVWGTQGQILVCASFTHTHTPNSDPEGDSPVSIAQSIQSVFSGHMAWWDVGDHAGFGIANERVLQHLFETEGRSVKSTNKGHIDYLWCSGHWAILIPTTFYKKAINKRRNTNDQ